MMDRQFEYIFLSNSTYDNFNTFSHYLSQYGLIAKMEHIKSQKSTGLIAKQYNLEHSVH